MNGWGQEVEGFFYFTILLRASSVCCFSKRLHPAIQEKIMWKMKTIFHIITFYWTKIQWALHILGSASADSTDLGSKIFEKKSRKFPKANLQFAACSQPFTEHLHCIYSYRQTSFYCTFQISHVLLIEGLWQPCTKQAPIGAIFPKAFSHFVFLCHISVILSTAQAFSLLLGLAGAEDAGDMGSFLGSGRSPGEGNGNPLQCFCLENPTDRGAWRTVVHGVTKSEVTEHTHYYYNFCGDLCSVILGITLRIWWRLRWW